MARCKTTKMVAAGFMPSFRAFKKIKTAARSRARGEEVVLRAFCKRLWGADDREREPWVDWRQLPRQTATKTGWQCGKGAKNDSGKFVLLVNKTGNALGVCLCAQFYCVFLHSFKSFVFKIHQMLLCLTSCPPHLLHAVWGKFCSKVVWTCTFCNTTSPPGTFLKCTTGHLVESQALTWVTTAKATTLGWI